MVVVYYSVDRSRGGGAPDSVLTHLLLFCLSPLLFAYRKWIRQASRSLSPLPKKEKRKTVGKKKQTRGPWSWSLVSNPVSVPHPHRAIAISDRVRVLLP
jgi:hypothetical protein